VSVSNIRSTLQLGPDRFHTLVENLFDENELMLPTR
jgi:hypothetical protein